MKTKTPWRFEGELLESPDGKFGFTYLVTCTHPDFNKKYIGRKFFYTNFGKKTKQKESDWATYKTSSKYVAEAIALYGLEYFEFDILHLYDTRAGVVAGEVETQWEARVLYALNDDGERAYINQAIGNIKFVPKEFLSDEHKANLSKALMGRPKPPEGYIGNTNAVGSVRSDAHKAAISKAQKERVRK